MTYQVSDRHTGEPFESFETPELAQKAVERYEASDRFEGEYLPDRYLITDLEAEKEREAEQFRWYTPQYYVDALGMEWRTWG